MRRANMILFALCAAAIMFSFTGCGDPIGHSDVFPDDVIYKETVEEELAPDIPVQEEVFESYYKLTITLPHGDTIVLDRDLSGNDEFFSFGSTHIAPAISFAMTETLYNAAPQVSFAIVILNFGIIQGSDSFPIQTPGVGTYDFGINPPNIDITLDGLPYTSTKVWCSESGFSDKASCEGAGHQWLGATGAIVVDQWNKVEGGIFSGSFSGTLLEDSVKDPSPEIQIEGNYYFELPPTRH